MLNTMRKFNFQFEAPEGETNCATCPFKNDSTMCVRLAENNVCIDYNLKEAKIIIVDDTLFGCEVTNKELVDLLSKYPADAKVSIECCNPKTMRYNKEDNTIRID